MLTYVWIVLGTLAGLAGVYVLLIGVALLLLLRALKAGAMDG